MKTQWNTKPGPVRKFNQIAVNITKYNQIEVVIFLFFVISTRQAAFQPLSSSAFAADSSWRPRSLAANLCRNTDLPPRRHLTPIHTNTHQNHGGRPHPNPPAANLSVVTRTIAAPYFSAVARTVWKWGGWSSRATTLISIFFNPACSSQFCKSLSAKPSQRSP
jgi:hypothetical protein